MSSAEATLIQTEAERVFCWREQELERAGFDVVTAAELASRPDVDLHRAIQLLETGCPVSLAAEILR